MVGDFFISRYGLRILFEVCVEISRILVTSVGRSVENQLNTGSEIINRSYAVASS